MKKILYFIFFISSLCYGQSGCNPMVYGCVYLNAFNSTSYTNLMDFPMWKVLEGATTGCLRPITVNIRGVFFTAQ